MVRAAALLLTLLTGFSGLVYEVVWQKYLATLLGSHSEATAAVLGIFLGGLSVGYMAFGAITRRAVDRSSGQPARLLSIYGLVEASIGVWALAFPWLFRAAAGASVRLPALPEGLGFAADVLLTTLLIGPPTVLMGGTIPMLTQALSSSLRDATRLHALVYGSNTAGAFAGALAAGFVLVPWLGLDAAMRSMGLVNLAAGGAFLLLGWDRRRAIEPPARPPGRAPAPATTPTGIGLLAAVALLSGFSMMAIQTILNRIAALSVGASQFTFSVVVAAFVLCIALGSFVVSALRRIPTGAAVVTQWLLVAILVVLYLEVPNAPYWTHVVRTWFASDPGEFILYQLTLAAFFLLVLAVPIGLSGALLPLLFHALRREMTDLGASAGRLYGANTVGSLVGSLVGGYLLLYWLDLHQVARIAVFSIAVSAFLLSLRLTPGKGVVFSGASLALSAIAVVALPDWDAHRLTAGTFRLRTATPSTSAGAEAFFASRDVLGRMLFHRDDPTVTASVRETEGGSRGLFTNGKPDTLIPTELMTVVMLGVVPCLFADECHTAFVIGLGTGATAGALGSLDDMERIVVAEISPGVAEALPLFAMYNDDAGRNPRIEVRRGDAYRTLLRDQSQYDVIISEPSNPWVTGVENLYSREFLTSAKQRLRPGGVYAQWFHAYESSLETLELVLRTYASVFDSIAVWRGAQTDLILLGWNGTDHALDVDRIEQRMKQPDYAAQLRRIQRDAPLALLAHERLPLGVVPVLVGPGETLSLFHPALSHRAGIDFFAGRVVELPSSAALPAALIGTRNSLVRRHLEARGESLSDEERRDLVSASCTESARGCATLMAWWAAANPTSELLQETAHYFVDHNVVTPSQIDELEQLYYPDHRGDGGVEIDPSDASALVEIFRSYFSPSVPFRRSALRAALARCRDTKGGIDCEAVRREAEAILGDLTTEVSSRDDLRSRPTPEEGPGGSMANVLPRPTRSEAAP